MLCLTTKIKTTDKITTGTDLPFQWKELGPELNVVVTYHDH